MKLFFSRRELIELLGFDDRRLLLIAIPLVAALANVLFVGAQAGAWGPSITACYVISLAHTALFYVGSRYTLLLLRYRLPRSNQTLLRVTLAIVFLLIFVVAVELTASPFIEAGLGLPQVVQGNLLTSVLTAYTLVIAVMAIYEGVYFFAKYKRSLLERERLAKANAQAQLSVLKQQMNPHFLFNSLNTLVNLIPEDSRKATLFTQRLAAVYRRILEYRHKELIPLEEEVRALRDYVFLMQTRFEEKLQISYRFADNEEADEGTQVQDKVGEEQSWSLPFHLRTPLIVPLSLQLLVENAIKHNVVSNDHPLVVTISFTDEAVTVTNSLHLRERNLSSTSWGHENLRSRFSAATDRPIDIRQTATQYTISLPLLTEATVAPQLAHAV